MNVVGAFEIMPIGTDGMIFVLPQHISVVFSEHRKINGVACSHNCAGLLTNGFWSEAYIHIYHACNNGCGKLRVLN